MFDELLRRLRISAGFSKANAEIALEKYKLGSLEPIEMDAIWALRGANGESNSYIWGRTLDALNYKITTTHEFGRAR